MTGKNYKKIIIFIVTFCIFIFFISLSSSNSHKSLTTINYKVAFSNLLVNELSDLSEFYAIDSVINIFIKKYNIKGASVAISKEGRLVYAKGFGYADYENKVKVEPKNLFRVASVSKLITATAIMKLNEEGKLSLNDYVFGEKGWLNDSIFLKYKDKRVEKITILDLLCHKSGWNGRRKDPVLYPQIVYLEKHISLPITIEQAVQYQLSRPLSYNPGTVYSYSNFGYVLLSLIIEKVTGINYEDYVKQNILEPLEIFDIHIGNNFSNDKLQNEVKYYSNFNPQLKRIACDGSMKTVPAFDGGYDLKLLSGAGGWIASAAGLLKLIVSLDGFSEKQDILTEESIKLMTSSVDTLKAYIGWRNGNQEGTWWRTGTLDGSIALVVRRPDNICYAILLNTNAYSRYGIHQIMANQIHKAINNIKNWPDYDLFDIQQIYRNLAVIKLEKDSLNLNNLNIQ